jgi:uncharacterized SAM-binding protein YcdF (DUF218 family)
VEAPASTSATRQRNRFVRFFARRWRSLLAASLISVLVLGALGAVFTYRWFVNPTSSRPARVDAVVVFAGGEGERLATALDLIDRDVSDVLIVNEGVDWFGPESSSTHQLCDNPPEDVEVICLKVLPDSTKGEGQAFAKLAESREFNTLASVSSDHHLVRATRWLRRCFDGDVIPVAADAQTTRQMVEHEWAATLVQLTVDRGCDDD